MTQPDQYNIYRLPQHNGYLVILLTILARIFSILSARGIFIGNNILDLITICISQTLALLCQLPEYLFT